MAETLGATRGSRAVNPSWKGAGPVGRREMAVGWLSHRSSMKVPATTQRSAETMGSRLPARILIAEDHLDSRDALRALLEAFGYAVLLASNGKEAVDAAVARSPDLILMDIMMPVMDGFEATRQLRQMRKTGRTPIIAVTAMEGADELALQAGADDYVRKPIDIRVLLAKLNALLARRADA